MAKTKDSNTDSYNDVEKIDSINTLNVDCLAIIFMYLSITERIKMDKVCSKWRNACEFSWYNVKKIVFTKSVIQSRFQLYGKDYNYVNKVVNIESKILPHCGRFLTHLIFHDFNSNENTNSIIKLVNQYCPNLIEFTFELNLSKQSSSTFENSKSLKCLNIKIFNASSCTEKEFQEFYNFLNSLSTKIEDFSLENMDNENFDFSVSNSLILAIERLSSLRRLTLKSFDINDSIIEKISHIPGLIYLDLSGSRITNKKSSIKNFVNLEHLNLTRVNDFIAESSNESAIIADISKYKKLKYLNLSLFNGESLRHTLPQVINSNNLEYLNISESHGIVDDELIIAIAYALKNLKYFNILQCPNVSPFGVKALLSNLNNLETLLVRSLKDIDDEVYISLHKLRHLECSLFTTDPRTMIKQCPSLEILIAPNWAILPKYIPSIIELTSHREHNVSLTIYAQLKILECLNYDISSITSFKLFSVSDYLCDTYLGKIK